MDMDFKSNPFVLIWIEYRLDFKESNPWPPLQIYYVSSLSWVNDNLVYDELMILQRM